MCQQRLGAFGILSPVALFQRGELLQILRRRLQIGPGSAELARPLPAGGDRAEEVRLGLKVLCNLVLRLPDLPLGVGKCGALRLDLPPNIARQPVQPEKGNHHESRPENRGGKFQKWAFHWITVGKRSHLPPGLRSTCSPRTVRSAVCATPAGACHSVPGIHSNKSHWTAVDRHAWP